MTRTVVLLLAVLACLLFSGPAAGPAVGMDAPGLIITPDLQFSYAQELFNAQDHIAAQVEFKRFVRFFPGDPRADEARFRTGESLYRSGQFYEAAKAFNTMISEDSPFSEEACFLQSKAFLAMNNTGYAQIVLQNYLKLTDKTKTRDRIYLELAKIHIMETRELGKDSLDSAEKYLTLISPENRDSHDVPYQLAAIKEVRQAPQKSPALSGILAIIPGGGFLYCERYKDAFVTFCLNAGLIYAAYEAFNHDNPGIGGIITFVEAGFYAGNIHGSVTAAHKYNKARQVEILNRTFNINAGIDPGRKSYVLTLSHAF